MFFLLSCHDKEFVLLEKIVMYVYIIPVSLAILSSNRTIAEDFIKTEYLDCFHRWVNSFDALKMSHFT